MAHVHAADAAPLLRIECRTCGAWFCLCSRCYGGQRYCCERCRETARARQTDRARRRYAQSEKGRANQKERQRRYRRHHPRRVQGNTSFFAKSSSPEKSVTDRSTAVPARLYTGGHESTLHEPSRRGAKYPKPARWSPSTRFWCHRCQRCGTRGRVLLLVPQHAVSPSFRRLR
jgi:hypothetical protein